MVGYDNSTYARLCEPELTSVDNKPEQVALLCVQLLQSRIEHGEDYSSVTLQPELVQRQSSLKCKILGVCVSQNVSGYTNFAKST